LKFKLLIIYHITLALDMKLSAKKINLLVLSGCDENVVKN